MECKICGGKIIRQCKCLRGDVTCENDHSYHWSPFHKVFHEGISDHSKSINSRDCCEDKKKINM